MRTARLHLLMATLVTMLAGCAPEPVPAPDSRDVIVLRWVQAYAGESRADVETGLLWSLSLLGAKLPEDAQVLRWQGERVTLDLAAAQVHDGTLPAWRELLAAMKASGEYQKHGALDVGRFVALTLGSAERYYALTGVPSDYSSARGRHRFEARSAAIVKSAVAHGGRRIDIALADTPTQIAFVAFEGRGSLADGTFAALEMEVVDVMPNGQLRFALYGLDGRLKQGASRELTTAGKPAKCMWCHESTLQTTLVDFAGVAGYYDRREFDALVQRRRESLHRFRENLDSQIEYDNLQDHTYAELLYLTFEAPSRERLAREWGVSLAAVSELLRGKPTHAHEEFPELGSQLYRRVDVDSLAPYAVLAAPPSVREVVP